MSLSNTGRGWKLALVTAVMGTLVAGTALADNGKHRGWDRKYDDRRHSDYDYARVVDVDPIVRRIRVTEPVRECYEETRYEREPRYDSRGASRGSAGSMILGGIIGAAVGNQIGSGDGRRAATVAGAIIGSAVGHDAAARREAREGRYDSRYDDRYQGRPYTVERCDVREVESWEERIEGYHVTYDYQGRRGSMTLPYDPGPKVRVRVDVRPAEY
jgi:uncharacterized protein YcfJ